MLGRQGGTARLYQRVHRVMKYKRGAKGGSFGIVPRPAYLSYVFKDK